MKNIIFPIGAIALIILAFSNRKTIIQPDETPKIDLTLEPVGEVNIDETPILEKYIQNSLKDPETKSYSDAIIVGVAGIAGALGTANILLQQQEKSIKIRRQLQERTLKEEGTELKNVIENVEKNDLWTTEQIIMIEKHIEKTNKKYTFFNEDE